MRTKKFRKFAVLAALAMVFGLLAAAPASAGPRQDAADFAADCNDDGTVANGAIVYEHGERVGVHKKRLLPTYDIFDEDRYFEPGGTVLVADIGGTKIGVAVCEDLWRGDDVGLSGRYDDEPDHAAGQGHGPDACPSSCGSYPQSTARRLQARHRRRPSNDATEYLPR